MICKTLKKIVGEKTNFLKRWRSFLLRFLALFERDSASLQKSCKKQDSALIENLVFATYFQSDL